MLDPGIYYVIVRAYGDSLIDDYSLSVSVSDDTIAPVVSNVAADITEPTEQSVTVTAEFSDNVEGVSKLYRIEGGSWSEYPSDGVVVSKNGTVYFKAVDAAGNESEIVSYEVKNIIQAELVDAYGDNHSFATAYDLGSDDAIQSADGASIAFEGEVDYFSFTLTQDADVTLTTTGNAESVDTILTLYDNEGNEITHNDDYGSTSFSSVARRLAPVTYYATVHAYEKTGKYSLQVRVLPDDGVSVFSGDLAGATKQIIDGRSAKDVNIHDGGYLQVLSGGSAADTVVNPGGSLEIENGGIADKIRENGGFVTVETDTDAVFESHTIDGLELTDHNYATLHSGTTATNGVIASPTLYVYSSGSAVGTTVNRKGLLYIYSGGIARNTMVSPGGDLHVTGDGSAYEVTENGGFVLLEDGADVTFAPNTFAGLGLIRENSATLHSGTTATDTFINPEASLFVFSGGTANGVAVCSGGSLLLSSGGKLTGNQTYEAEAVVSMAEGAILNFDLSQAKAGTSALVNDLSIIQGQPVYSLTVNTSLNPGTYDYELAEGVSAFDGTISVVNNAGNELGTLAAGETLTVGNDQYTLNLTDSALSVTVTVREKTQDSMPKALVGTTEKVSWEASGAEQYVVEYSTDDFEHGIQVVTTGSAVDTPDLPAGTYRWRVKADGSSSWVLGDMIVSEADSSTPKVVQAAEDGNDDLFFASTNGIWEGIYCARHVGSINDWTGTKDVIPVNGRGRIQNLFFGSADPNVLCLTDGENGDAIFVDDVYTDSPENMAKETSRLYRIQEIRAGAGNDIVDMTSQLFEYTGDGLTIRGGDGNDTIWANKGDNRLFGDAGNDRIVGASGDDVIAGDAGNDRIVGASGDDVIAGGIGNDRMHGGGGNDVFTFCDNWGADEVEQLTGGSVTLWFASGDESQWDPDTLTYTDGENSVTVKGVTAVNLKFGNDGSAQYGMLASIGAFAEFTSQKIFEDSGKGLLA